jgi:hypothetical protein
MVEQNCVYNGQRIHAEVCCYLGLHELLLEREKRMDVKNVRKDSTMLKANYRFDYC